MCGRFALTEPKEAMAQLFDAGGASDNYFAKRFNICPTTEIATVLSAKEGRVFAPMRWGFAPHWYKAMNDGPLLINARAETIAEKPAFREAARLRRCLIPASGFYEWKRDGKAKTPYYITRRDAPMVFAGVYQDYGDVTTVAMVTTGTNADLEWLHHRLPVMIAPDDFGLWLGEEGKGAALLMVPPPVGVLAWHEVSPRVNKNTSEGPELIEPIEVED